MQNALIWIIVAIIILGGGYWLWQNGAPAPAETPSAQTDTTSGADTTGGTSGGVTVDVNTSAGTGTPASATVSYDGSSFTPSSVTIAKGGTVTFTGPALMWIASAPHPSHTGYDGTSRSTHCATGYSGAKPFDQCATGSSFSFTFDKAGTWPYHDHNNATAFGKVVVQ